MELVKLNVGGWKYTTTKSTLLQGSANGSFFQGVLVGSEQSMTNSDVIRWFINKSFRKGDSIGLLTRMAFSL